jgi:hypothetical protein
MHHHRIDGGLLQQNDVARKRLRDLLRAHGMAAIFDDDGFIVILLHVRQRLGQDAGLVERTDMRQVGHEGGLVVSGVGRFLSDWRAPRKVRLSRFLHLPVTTGIPRMLRSAPHFAAWCAADPGSI